MRSVFHLVQTLSVHTPAILGGWPNNALRAALSSIFRKKPSIKDELVHAKSPPWFCRTKIFYRRSIHGIEASLISMAHVQHDLSKLINHQDHGLQN